MFMRELRKLQSLQGQLIQLDAQKVNYDNENSKLVDSVNNYTSKIEQGKIDIQNAKNQIKKDQQNIEMETQNVKDMRQAIVKMDKLEKGIFGRKMYRKNVHLRNQILVTMRKEEIEKLNKQMEEKARIEKEKKERAEKEKLEKERLEKEKLERERVEKENKEKAHAEVEKRINQMKEKQDDRKQKAQDRWQEVNKNVEEARVRNMSKPVVSKKNTNIENNTQRNQQVQNLVNVLQMLAQNGLVQQPVVSLQSNNNPSLLSGAINTISLQDLITLSYSIGYQFELGRMQAMKEQMQQNMDNGRIEENGKIYSFEEGRKRVLAKRSAFVSLPIMILILGVVAFMVVMLLLIR